MLTWHCLRQYQTCLQVEQRLVAPGPLHFLHWGASSFVGVAVPGAEEVLAVVPVEAGPSLASAITVAPVAVVLPAVELALLVAGAPGVVPGFSFLPKTLSEASV